MKSPQIRQIRALIEDEAGLSETLTCYKELSALIASADDLNPDTLWMLLDTINRQFSNALNGIASIINGLREEEKRAGR